MTKQQVDDILADRTYLCFPFGYRLLKLLASPIFINSSSLLFVMLGRHLVHESEYLIFKTRHIKHFLVMSYTAKLV